MRTNVKAPAVPAPRTHAGAVATRINPEQALRRSVMSCMLWENEFYESGEDIAKRIAGLVAQVPPETVAAIAVEARTQMKLRHVPLHLAVSLARQRVNVAALLPQIIQRPDELTEFLALYWKDGKVPLAASVKRGLGVAFQRFNAYSLAKYNRDDKIKLRDVLFLSHAKPRDEEQAATWKQLVSGTLPVPDTWEVALSSGADKRETWIRLLAEQKLGALALLRNLRNMEQAKVPESDIRAALQSCKTDWVLPFRFLSAARHAPKFEDVLEGAMFRCLANAPRLAGKTALILDGSGSMDAAVSGKSELSRLDAAAALGILVREVCEQVAVFVFSNNTFMVPPRRGFALRDAIHHAAEKGGTNTAYALAAAAQDGYTRCIVITDEQSHQTIGPPLPGTKGFFINVASAQNGVGYGPWCHIDGWSEACLDYIQASEGVEVVEGASGDEAQSQ